MQNLLDVLKGPITKVDDPEMLKLCDEFNIFLKMQITFYGLSCVCCVNLYIFLKESHYVCLYRMCGVCSAWQVESLVDLHCSPFALSHKVRLR